MERLRILAAAAALRVFTVSELCAYSGANENTVQSVLRRQNSLFKKAPAARTGGSGRPPTRYLVQEPDRIRAEVEELERSLRGEPRAALPMRDSDDELLMAVGFAEDAVLRCWRADDSEERAILSRTAVTSAREARRVADASAVKWAPVRRRAGDVEVFADLVQADSLGEVKVEQLQHAATALADFAEVAPPAQTVAFMTGLTATAMRSHELPPLALVIQKHRGPVDMIMGLDATCWAKTEPISVKEHAVWSQKWAQPLAQRGLFAGLVLQDESGESCALQKLHALRWSCPTLVVSHSHDLDLVGRVSRSGAYFVPWSHGVSGVADTVKSAIQHGGLSGATTEAQDGSGAFGAHGIAGLFGGNC